MSEQLRREAVESLVKAMPEQVPARKLAETWVDYTGEKATVMRLERELAETRAALDRARQVLVDLDNGGHASSGRDFGRGVAYAARLVTEAITPRQETRP